MFNYSFQLGIITGLLAAQAEPIIAKIALKKMERKFDTIHKLQQELKTEREKIEQKDDVISSLTYYAKQLHNELHAERKLYLNEQ